MRRGRDAFRASGEAASTASSLDRDTDLAAQPLGRGRTMCWRGWKRCLGKQGGQSQGEVPARNALGEHAQTPSLGAARALLGARQEKWTGVGQGVRGHQGEQRSGPVARAQLRAVLLSQSELMWPEHFQQKPENQI